MDGLARETDLGFLIPLCENFGMHVPKSLNEAITNGWAIGRQADLHDRMRICITNYLKKKFLDAMIVAVDKPFGPAELGDLLADILSGRK